jgi:hypothetical protein
MPKVTVYVSDDLLDKARALPDGDKFSQLVQRGLTRLLDEEGPEGAPAYATRPEGTEKKIIALRKKFLEEAEREYAIGYSTALEIADALPLWSLNELAESGFHVPSWLRPYVATAHAELVEGRIGDENLIAFHATNSSSALAEMFAGLGRLPQPNRQKTEWWWVWRIAKVLGTMANPLDFDRGMLSSTNARVRGFTDGLRELWEAIESPGLSRTDDVADFIQRRRHNAAGAEVSEKAKPRGSSSARVRRQKGGDGT